MKYLIDIIDKTNFENNGYEFKAKLGPEIKKLCKQFLNTYKSLK